MEYQGIIQARVGSSRLPEKVLLPFGEETVLEFLLRRLQFSERVDRWLVATTSLPEDDPVESVARARGFAVFRGAADDVLDRLYWCARDFGMDHIVRVGADNPLLDPRIIDETISAYEVDSSGWDYFSNHHPPSFPDGEEVEILPLRALETAWQNAHQPYERTHATPYLWDQPDVFRVGNYSRPGENLYYKHRWTLDYPEDYDLLRRVVAAFSGRYDFSQEEILEFLDRNPDVSIINVRHRGATWQVQERDNLRTIGQYETLTDRRSLNLLRRQRRKVCCITGSRAEYSRLRPVLKALNADERVELQIVCSGTHVLERYGNSMQDIIDDGLEVTTTCFMLVEGETLTTMSKSIGLGIVEFSTVLANLEPDILMVIGDRFDAIASALAASAMNIPIAHIQGGEVSGSVDEALRHAITKLAQLHFPSTALSRDRIISMGEDPRYVFNVGCPSVDSLLSTPLLSTEEVLSHPLLAPKRSARTPFAAEDGYVLSLFHPVTTEYDQVGEETMKLVIALDELGENVFWVWPNADAGARKIVRTVDHYVQRNGGRFDFFDHIPMELFVSLMARSKLIVGNSSAGIREACYFGIPVVNVGTRQRGRERALNVLDVEDGAKDAIVAAMRAQLTHGPYPVSQIYGDGRSGLRIAQNLAGGEIPPVQKHFFVNVEQGRDPVMSVP